MLSADAKLVERCRSGEGSAWETLVRLYSQKLYNLSYRFTRRFDKAEELTQEIFLKVYQQLDAFDAGTGSLQNWILKVGRNLIIDNYRRTKWEKNVAGSEALETLDFPMPSTRGPEVSLYDGERSGIILEGLERLTPELKEAVILRDLEELSYHEIADILEIPEGTVKSRINRGRIELARLLGSRRKDLTMGV
ncbi:MAG: RNA polymerase sigma factor [Acidobacteriota bacterium]